MTPPPLDALAVKKMASGHLSLNLSEKVTWEGFPNYAAGLLRLLDGKLLNQSDGVDIRLWKVEIAGRTISLVFDDYPLMVAFESSDLDGDALIEDLHQRLSPS